LRNAKTAAMMYVDAKGIDMPKTTAPYWNALLPENGGKWTPVRGLEGVAE
jgi:hypothetical protein